MDSLIDFIAVFPDGNCNNIIKEIKKCSMPDIYDFVKELDNSQEAKILNNINSLKYKELLYVIFTEVQQRHNLKFKFDIHNVNNVKNNQKLSINAEEYIPNEETQILINFNDYIPNNHNILNYIYFFFTNETDINGYTPIMTFCNKYNLSLIDFIEIVKNNEYIQIINDKFKSVHPSTIDYINNIKKNTLDNIYMIFNNKNNYYYQFLESNYICLDYLIKDSTINEYFNYDTLVFILKNDFRFEVYGNYVKNTI
jgi:hypothetical protein